MIYFTFKCQVCHTEEQSEQPMSAIAGFGAEKYIPKHWKIEVTAQHVTACCPQCRHDEVH